VYPGHCNSPKSSVSYQLKACDERGNVENCLNLSKWERWFIDRFAAFEHTGVFLAPTS